MHSDEIISALAIDINFQKVSCSLKQGFRGRKKCILEEVSGSFKSAELTAIMGPSGAGKTTLLNILTGFQKNFTGKVAYQSERSELNWKTFKKYSRYIQQDDALFPFFTVQETISIAAELKLGKNLSRDTKEKVIDDVLSSLDLIRTKDTRCAMLSGGERKRLSIALEMVNNPLVMFLDEPTTGLDSTAAMQCATVMKNLARNCRTIICTIHQPSSPIFEMFDQVYLVAEGRCVYHGDPMTIVTYLSRVGLTCPKYHNPADYVMEVMCNEYGNFNKRLADVHNDSWRNMYKNLDVEKYEKQEITATMNSPSEFNNARVLLNRCLLRFYKDWQTTIVKLIIYVGLGLLMGMTYYDCGFDANKFQTNLGMLVLLGIIVFYCSLLPAVLKFPFELLILRKEHLNDWYKIRTHYVTFIVTGLIFQSFFVVTFTTIVYLLSSQPLELERYVMFETMMILFSFIGEGIGLMLGIYFEPVAGIFGCIVVGVSQVSFCGYFIYYNHMSRYVSYFSNIMFTRYVTEGILHAIYGYKREKLDCPSDMIYCHFRTPQIFLTEVQLKHDNFTLDVVILIFHTIVLFTLAYYLLKKKVSSV